MANKKGEKVEAGIWKNFTGKGYVAEISYSDPQTGRRVREQKSVNRRDLARDWRQTRKADALRGEIKGKKESFRPIRFKAFTEEYLAEWSKVKKRESTYIRDTYSIKQLTPVFGMKYLCEVTRRDVERYTAARAVAGRTPATINRELCCLKNMLRKAVDWGYLKENPAGGIKQEKEYPPEFEILTEEEIDRFINAASDRLRALFVLAVHTGMRRGELFKLEWQDIDFSKGTRGFITVRDTKNHDTRHIPMNLIVQGVLKKHPPRILQGRKCPLVFSNDEGSSFRSIQTGFVSTLKQAGIEKHIRFHDLRHTFASRLVMKGVDLHTVAKLMGHRDIKMTMRYAHLAPEHLQSAVDSLTRKDNKGLGRLLESR